MVSIRYYSRCQELLGLLGEVLIRSTHQPEWNRLWSGRSWIHPVSRGPNASIRIENCNFKNKKEQKIIFATFFLEKPTKFLKNL